LKIIQVHNYYQNPTGDDAVVKEEYQLLTQNGHEVIPFTKSNKALINAGFFSKLQTGLSLKSSAKIKDEFYAFLNSHNPNLVHVHNIYPLITPAVFEVCNTLKIPVVQTLHNYRLLCVNTLFYRDGNTCEDCLEKGHFEGVKHRCYNGSFTQSYAMASSLVFHSNKDTWNLKVDAFICLSEFAKSKFVKGGIKESKLYVKPNFVNPSSQNIEYQDFWLYAGKLEEQKGLYDFLELAQRLPKVRFKVAGFLEDLSLLDNIKNVEFLGQLSREDLMYQMSKCKGVLFLSKMYEGMPMTIIEAFAHKKMVIARNQGAMSEMISSRENGHLYNNLEELTKVIEEYDTTDSSQQLGRNAYSSYKMKYHSDLAYQNLMDIYTTLID